MRWVLVSGGFHKHSGMGRASYEFARYLLERGDQVEAVTYEIDSDLGKFGQIKVHLVSAPLGSHLLADFALGMKGKRVAQNALEEDSTTRILVCGGNCNWPDVNWVHSLHSAWKTQDKEAPWFFRIMNRITKRISIFREKRSIGASRVVIANSHRTQKDVIQHIQVNPSRVNRVYLGSDPEIFSPTPQERLAARKYFGVSENETIALFVGALGYDANKGFDTLLSAWSRLKANDAWDVKLLAAGSGRGIENWKSKVIELGLSEQVQLLGYVKEIPLLLACGDILVSPVRYESYGLNVHEAIQRGLPAIVSSTAGISERYPEYLNELILKDPENVEELCRKLGQWRSDVSGWKSKLKDFQNTICAYTWKNMSEDMVRVITSK